MNVWVHSNSKINSEALSALVQSFGFAAHSQQEGNTDAALWDLSTTPTPYPTPGTLPTLALNISSEGDMVNLLRQGYRGCLTPGESSGSLRRALEAVKRGEIWTGRQVLTRAFDNLREPKLTPREREVHKLILEGLSNRAIAKDLDIAERTVKVHISNIFGKLGVGSRVELILNQRQAELR